MIHDGGTNWPPCFCSAATQTNGSELGFSHKPPRTRDTFLTQVAASRQQKSVREAATRTCSMNNIKPWCRFSRRKLNCRPPERDICVPEERCRLFSPLLASDRRLQRKRSVARSPHRMSGRLAAPGLFTLPVPSSAPAAAPRKLLSA